MDHLQPHRHQAGHSRNSGGGGHRPNSLSPDRRQQHHHPSCGGSASLLSLSLYQRKIIFRALLVTALLVSLLDFQSMSLSLSSSSSSSLDSIMFLSSLGLVRSSRSGSHHSPYVKQGVLTHQQQQQQQQQLNDEPPAQRPVAQPHPEPAPMDRNRPIVPREEDEDEEHNTHDHRGPRDFCLQGRLSGRTFNWIATLGNALMYRDCFSSSYLDASSSSSSTTPTQKSVVRLDPDWMAFYNQWFEPDPTKFLPLHGNANITDKNNKKDASANTINCGTIHPVRQVFYAKLTPHDDSDLMIDGQACPQQSPYRTGIHLLPSYKQSYLTTAQAALQEYKQPQVQHNPIIVTVHQRWLEGGCTRRALRRHHNTCPYVKRRTEVLDDGAAMPETNWGFTCFYNETLVRQQLPDHVLQGRSAMNRDEVIVLLLGDGQRDASPEVQTFAHIDQHDFAVQIGMMLLK
ncbi:hypothetical protein ACA910_015740 [Epithemia clementina (nom. ined.)]